PELIDDVNDGQEVILVDHNESTQSPDNIANAKILKVVDHHTMKYIAPYQLYYRAEDRKSTRLNSSHVSISYAVFCLKKKSNIGCIKHKSRESTGGLSWCINRFTGSLTRACIRFGRLREQHNFEGARDWLKYYVVSRH